MSTSQQSAFSALPGVEVPVAEVQTALARLWEGSTAPGEQEPEEFRASQMNVIIHLGREVTPEDALEKFQGALRFAQRYPCRIVVLCPERTGRGETLMTLKLFSECYVGKTQRERSCCEALILAYPGGSKDFLENQVSVLLENDLPTYYWFHRFASARNAGRYSSFLRTCKRIVYDSGLETPDAADIEWPHPGRVRDLVHARLLPVRQSIGQFLSSVAPEALWRDLVSVELRHTPRWTAEARVILEWFRVRLAACGDPAGADTPPEGRLAPAGRDAAFPFELRCEYGDGRYFFWKADFDTDNGLIEANLDRGETTLPMSVSLLSLEKELAEAFFF